MKIIMKPTLSFSCFIITLSLLFSSCKKDGTSEQKMIQEETSDFKLQFGQDTTLVLTSYDNTTGPVDYVLSFDETADIKISESSKLHDKLKDAIQVDRENKKIVIKSGLLYPNSEVSTTNGATIPPMYKVKLRAVAKDGKLLAEKLISFVLQKSTVNIQSSNGESSAFIYTLFSDKASSFELFSEATRIAGTSWNAKSKGIDGEAVKIENNKVVFLGTTGSLTQKEEKTYELEPQLLKDGFAVASSKIKFIFIPAIQFVYGTYYPDLNLTVKYNYLVVDLQAGYVSKAPAFYPESYKGKFSIDKIEWNNKPYDDSKGTFTINEDTGIISTKAKNDLQKGSYKLTIKATANHGLEFTTPMTLVLE